MSRARGLVRLGQCGPAGDTVIDVVMEALQDLADKPIGVSFDQLFDAVENDLLSQECLGASGIHSIYESDERVPRDACRVLTRTENSLADRISS